MKHDAEFEEVLGEIGARFFISQGECREILRDRISGLFDCYTIAGKIIAKLHIHYEAIEFNRLKAIFIAVKTFKRKRGQKSRQAALKKIIEDSKGPNDILLATHLLNHKELLEFETAILTFLKGLPNVSREC